MTTSPTHCPVCGQDLVVTRLECSACATEVTGRFSLGRLAMLREPHASLIEMFLRVRGNVKDMERELGLSYPTVRARLDEAFNAAGYEKAESSMDQEEADLGSTIRAHVQQALERVNIEDHVRMHVERGLSRVTEMQERDRGEQQRQNDMSAARKHILDQLERGEITPTEAATLLRELKARRA